MPINSTHNAGVFAETTGLKVVLRAGGSFVLTRKFVEGMSFYASRWPGRVVAVMQPDETESSNLDNVELRPADIPFEVKCLRYDSRELREYLATCGLVHWGPHHLLHDLADVLSRSRTPSVYCTEYSLQTRLQIIDAEVSNPLRRLRKYLWEYQEERRIRKNIPKVAGFEANGTPTFESYGSLSTATSLFFDNRMSSALMIAREELETRLHNLESAARPMRLVFSGRLNKMKGALDVIDVAHELNRRGAEFELSICGGGEVEPQMRERIERLGLIGRVVMKGVLDFSTELVPFVKSNADVFVCCHKQGDPSCTYLETYGCGVPIAGYLNEAFAGLLRHVDAGWGVPLNQPSMLADLLIRLSHNRSAVSEKSRRALEFAKDNCMETTFERRVEFFKKCAKLDA